MRMYLLPLTAFHRFPMRQCTKRNDSLQYPYHCIDTLPPKTYGPIMCRRWLPRVNQLLASYQKSQACLQYSPMVDGHLDGLQQTFGIRNLPSQRQAQKHEQRLHNQDTQVLHRNGTYTKHNKGNLDLVPFPSSMRMTEFPASLFWSWNQTRPHNFTSAVDSACNDCADDVISDNWAVTIFDLSCHSLASK